MKSSTKRIGTMMMTTFSRLLGAAAMLVVVAYASLLLLGGAIADSGAVTLHRAGSDQQIYFWADLAAPISPADKSSPIPSWSVLGPS
jgi:hypothetical protein